MKRASLTIFGLIIYIAFFWNTIGAHGFNDHPAFHYPDERIKVHLAQECLFTGEIIWFKIYCTSSLFPAEELSRLAFIELVNGENAAILRKKILLNHGGDKIYDR